jgi:hypothetical protein
VLQTVQTVLAADKTTSSHADPPTVSLLLQNITTVAGSYLVIRVAATCFFNTVGTVTIICKVDGTTVVSQGLSVATSFRQILSFETKVTGLGAGAHTVELFWATDQNTVSCNPVTSPKLDRCTITTQEIS